MNKKRMHPPTVEIVSLNRELASFDLAISGDEAIESLLERVVGGSGTCGTNECQVNTVQKCNTNTCTSINTCGENNG